MATITARLEQAYRPAARRVRARRHVVGDVRPPSRPARRRRLRPPHRLRQRGPHAAGGGGSAKRRPRWPGAVRRVAPLQPAAARVRRRLGASARRLMMPPSPAATASPPGDGRLGGVLAATLAVSFLTHPGLVPLRPRASPRHLAQGGEGGRRPAGRHRLRRLLMGSRCAGPGAARAPACDGRSWPKRGPRFRRHA
jgi:hypothetical protein